MPQMPKMRYIHCKVKLSQQDYRIVRDFAAERCLSDSGFSESAISLALRFIIQDWHELRSLAARWAGSRPTLRRPIPPDHSDPDRHP